METKCFFGYKISNTRSVAYDYFSSKAFSFVHRDFVKVCILRGTRNLSFVLRRSLLRTFDTIWILVITLEGSNITASKSIRRER